jgi:hypothetical protein
VDVATETDDVIETNFTQEGKQLLIVEAAVRQNGDTAPGWREFRQSPQAGVLIVVALILEFFLPPHGQPQ